MPRHAKLTDPLIRDLPVPEKGYDLHFDGTLPGFGIRITAAGARSFFCNYTPKAGEHAGRERRATIGAFPTWTASKAREHASKLKRRVDMGEDPLAEAEAARSAPTLADVAERFIAEHFPKLRPATKRDYEAQLRKHVLPALASRRLENITFSDIDALHRKISARAPVVANRCVAILSKMFSLAQRWQWTDKNPTKGLERNRENKRTKYLSPAEIARVSEALAEHRDQQAADIIRILLLTGCRRGEAQGMKWADLDLDAGVWTKPGATTKQRTEHRVPLSAPARQMLLQLREQADPAAVFVFASDGATGHRVELKSNWKSICRHAGIEGVRLHDLRHTFASTLASGGASLPLIGALLGHTQPATTARYAHLMDDPLRQATERAGAVIAGKPSADVVPFQKGGR